jgi:hypothetical protein
VKLSIFNRLAGAFRASQDSGQQELQQVVASGRDHGVNGIAGTVSEIITGHAVLGLEMTNDGFDGGAPPQLAFDLRREPALLA